MRRRSPMEGVGSTGYGANPTRPGLGVVYQDDYPARARRGDLVYFDPPYHPISKMASLTAYDRGGTDELDQASLRDVLAELARLGAG